jgi:hypothetical protein
MNYALSMENDKEHIVRQLIKESGTEQPISGFADHIMTMVYEQAAQDAAIESNFIQLLQNQHLTEQPSKVFCNDVMTRISPVHQKKAAAIISKQTWYLIAASVLLTVIACYVATTPTAAENLPTSSLDHMFAAVFVQLDSMPVIYPAALFGMGALLFVDYFLRANRVVHLS